MNTRKIQRIGNGHYDKKPYLQHQNSKYLVSNSSSSDQKVGSVKGNSTSYQSPEQGSPLCDQSYSNKSCSNHSQKIHKDNDRDSENSDKYFDPPTPTSTETTSNNTQEGNKGSPITNHAKKVIEANTVTTYRPIGSLSPAVPNFVRNDLTSHVKNWPGDILANQALKLSKEAHILGNNCSRVSAKLKHARSIVRLTEVQGSLLDLKILFIEEQIKLLEKQKTKNLYMGGGD